MSRRLQIVLLCLTTGVLLVAQSADPKQPAPSPIYQVGKGVTPPTSTYSPEPHWSKASRKLGIKGAVVIGGYVGIDGRFHDATIVRSLHPSVDADAVEGIKKWKFKPCTKDGQPVNCELRMELAFRT
jgi:protein TonB